MVADLSLVIDGQEVRTQPGKTVIQAAMDAGLYIPYLCYYPGMKPYGACRMCVVEIENTRGTPASCTTPVANDMVVWTNTEQIQSLRKGITELVVSEHPHGCLTCHRIELCGPQDICLRHVSVTDRVRGLPQERPVRAQGHHPVRRHRPYDAPELQIPEPASREQRPLLRHGLQPVHRVRGAA